MSSTITISSRLRTAPSEAIETKEKTLPQPRRIAPTRAQLDDAMELARSPHFNTLRGEPRAVAPCSRETRVHNKGLLSPLSHRIAACDEVLTSAPAMAIITSQLEGMDLVRFHRAVQLPETRFATDATFRKHISTILRVPPITIAPREATSDLGLTLSILQDRLTRRANARPLLVELPPLHLEAAALHLAPRMQRSLDEACGAVTQYHQDVVRRNRAIISDIARNVGMATALAYLTRSIDASYRSGGFETEGWKYVEELKEYVRTMPSEWYVTPQRVMRGGMSELLVYPMSPKDSWLAGRIYSTLFTAVTGIVSQCVGSDWRDAEEALEHSEHELLSRDIQLDRTHWRLARGWDQMIEAAGRGIGNLLSPSGQ